MVYITDLRELRVTDFHKPGVYRGGRAWANAWGLFRRTQSLVGRRHRAAVVLVVFVEGGEIFVSSFFSSESTRHTVCIRQPSLIYLCGTSSRGVRTGFLYLINLVCMILFVVRLCL